MFGEVGFEALCQFAPREHDAPSTAFAFQPDIRAETCYGPFVGTARMLFAEPQVVIEVKVREHGFTRMKYDEKGRNPVNIELQTEGRYSVNIIN